MAVINKLAPWMTYYKELDMLFSEDKDVKVIFDESRKEIDIYVDGEKKAYALSQLLCLEKEFGKTVIKIDVIPSNGLETAENFNLFKEAFKGNKAFSYVKQTKGVFDITYVVFAHKIVQFFDDNLADVNGNCSTLYEDIARDVFREENSVFYCTDVHGVLAPTSLGKPVREWP